MNKKALALLAMLSLGFAGCSNKPMHFHPQQAGLSELDFYRAREQCAAEHNVGGWFMAGPAIAVAAVAVVGEARKQNARVGFQTCMAERGFVCKERCAVAPDSLPRAAVINGQLAQPVSPVASAMLPPPPAKSEPLSSERPVVKQQTAALPGLRIGTQVSPLVDALPLYATPARDAERLERLPKDGFLLVKSVSGDWLQVATPGGKTGWVIAASVTSKD